MTQTLLRNPTVKFWSRGRVTAIQGNEDGVTIVQFLRIGQKAPEAILVAGAFIYL